jgi:hypothetical protein
MVSMGKHLLHMFLCPNQCQGSTLAPRLPVVRRNLGSRPRVGSRLGFHRRPGFVGPEPTQNMHVDLTCVCMCDVGWEMKFLGTRCDLPPISMVRFQQT